MKNEKFIHQITFKPDFKSDEEYKKWYDEFMIEWCKGRETFLIIETKDGTYLIDKNDFKEIGNDNI